MGKNKFFVPILTFGMLLSALVACGSNSNSKEKSSAAGDSTPSASVSDSSSASKSSSSSKASSSSSKASSSQSSSSSQQQQVHVHDYEGEAKATVKNADEKEVRLYDCKDSDAGKIIAIKFADYSEVSKAFDTDANATKYAEVDASIWDDALMIAKTSGTYVTWKVNVDKAISNAKISFGITSTYGTHSTTSCSGKYSIKVNSGDYASWVASGTYADIGLDPSKRTFVVFQTINLEAGENTISLRLDSTSNRLLFGGDVKIAYDGDAVPVAAPATGYDITFVPAEHCKVLVYLGAKETVETNKAQSVNGDEVDPETNRYVPAKYVAEVKDDPDTPDVDESVVEVKPEIKFKLVFDDGYTADGNDISISGTMGNEWNKLCSEDADVYSVTKIKAAITITIAVREVTGEEPAGYLGTFNITHGTIKVYLGAKNTDVENPDTPDANGKYLSRNKDTGEASKAKAQFNFEIFPENGYEFVSGLALGGESSPIGVTQFVTGNFGNLKRDKKNGNLYSITKVASTITVNIVCTEIAQA